MLALGEAVRLVELSAGGVNHVIVCVAANAASVQLVSRDAAQTGTGVVVVFIAFITDLSAVSVSCMIHPLSAAHQKDAVSLGESRAIPAGDTVAVGCVKLITKVADRKTVSIGEVGAISTDRADENASTIGLVEVVTVADAGSTLPCT